MSKCDECRHEFEPKQPEIRALSKEQCEYILSKPRLTRYIYAYGKYIGYKDWEYEHWAFDSHDQYEYGLPVTDPFWREWDEMQKQPFHYDGGGERTHPEPVRDSLVGKRMWWDGKVYAYPAHKEERSLIKTLTPQFVVVGDKRGDGSYRCDLTLEDDYWDIAPDQLSETAPPLVKVWSIDKIGKVSKYKFYGQPDWERIKRENEGAEAIVVWSNDDSVEDEEGIQLTAEGTCYYIFHGSDEYDMMYFHKHNPVESIRAEIKKRNAPKFKILYEDDRVIIQEKIR